MNVLSTSLVSVFFFFFFFIVYPSKPFACYIRSISIPFVVCLVDPVWRAFLGFCMFQSCSCLHLQLALAAVRLAGEQGILPRSFVCFRRVETHIQPARVPPCTLLSARKGTESLEYWNFAFRPCSYIPSQVFTDVQSPRTSPQKMKTGGCRGVR